MVGGPAAPDDERDGGVATRRRRRRRDERWVDDWAEEGWEDEYWDEVVDDERLPRQGGRLKWVVFSLVAVLLVVLAIGGAGVTWVMRQINPPGDPGEPVTVAIDQGATTAEIADQLQERGIITNAGVFRWYFEWKDEEPFQAGYYSVRPKDSLGNIIEALHTAPDDVFFKVTFPEGFDLPRVGARLARDVPELDAERFVAAATSGEVRSKYQPPEVTSLEGLIFPDTYQIAGRDSEVAVLQRMVRQMEAVADRAGINEASARLGYTPYQLLTMASMVEKEAKTAEDRGKIARVLYNRIGAGMRLQIDATVIYALGGSVDRLTQAMIDSVADSPYNTYTQDGLPPGPIALPGRASIEAVLNPTENPPEGPWLYYVVIDAEGNHAFAQTFEGHLANIAQAERNGVR
jgi:UPF0755 protein